MKKIIIAVDAAIFGYVAVRAIIRSFSVSTTRNADSIPLVQPAAAHVVGSATPAASAVTSPRGVRHRIRRKTVSSLEQNSTTASEIVMISAREVTTSSADSADTSPLAGKESGTWEVPRIVGTTIILLYGEGLSYYQISKAVGLSARAVSRYLRGISPYPQNN